MVLPLKKEPIDKDDVYIGARSLDDFRYVKIAEGKHISIADTEAVEKIL